MCNTELLKRKIEYEGVKLIVLSYKLGISRTTLWSRLSGQSEFTTDEIKDISRALHLNEEERKKIFNKSSKDDGFHQRRPYVKRYNDRPGRDC